MDSARTDFDTRAFRDALGGFATGITVITACAEDGRRVGLTANSFNAVSLDPPLVLWSLDRRAQSLPIFRDVGHYAVNVLAADQMALSQRFAQPTGDKFVGLDYREGLGRTPLLEGCVACFECRNANRHDGGDHLIFIGEVARFELFDRPALLYHGGQYGLATPHPGGGADHDETQDRGETAHGRRLHRDDDLLYLLARASHQIGTPFQARLKMHGLTVEQWRVLATLSDGDGKSVSALADFVLIRQPTLTKIVDRMESEGLVTRRTAADDRRIVLVHMTDKGRRLVATLTVEAKDHEAAMLADYGPGEEAVLKMVLRTLIARTEA